MAYSRHERKELTQGDNNGNHETMLMHNKWLSPDAVDYHHTPNPMATAPTPAAMNMPGVPPLGGCGWQWPFMSPWPYMPPLMTPWASPPQPPGKYTGVIKSFNKEKGFGFIECSEQYQRYKRDVFLHKVHIGDMGIGQEVTFHCEEKHGMPQAKNVVPVFHPGVPPPAPAAVKPADGGKGGKQQQQNGKGKAGGKNNKGSGGKGDVIVKGDAKGKSKGGKNGEKGSKGGSAEKGGTAKGGKGKKDGKDGKGGKDGKTKGKARSKSNDKKEEEEEEE